MPIVKRILYDPSTYHNVEVFREASALQAPMSESTGTYSSVDDIDMSNTIGVMTQLSSLSVFALEMFHNLALLSEDINDRIKILSMRTNTVLSKLPAVEKKATSLDHEHDFVLVKTREKYLKNRDMITPPLFIKKTNYCSITNQYRLCTPLPQLWRIEMYIKNDEDCFKLYSFPGFFFQEWLRTEIILQEKRRLERKADKVKKKKMKKERHKQREEEREELYLRSLERAARVAEMEQEAQQLDIDDDVGAGDRKNKARLLQDGGGPKLGKKQRQQQKQDELSLQMPHSSILQVGGASPSGGGGRRGSVDIDEDAVGSQADSTEDETAAAGPQNKKKKIKMTKIAKKLGNVFGFNMMAAAVKQVVVKSEDEASDSENNTGGGNTPKAGGGGGGAHKQSVLDSGGREAQSAPLPMLKSNAFSKLFMNFNAKEDLDDLDMPADTTVTPPSASGAAGNGGVNGAAANGGLKRPSQTMDSVALSLLTGSRDKTNGKDGGAAGRHKNSTLVGAAEEDSHGRRRSVDRDGATAAATSAASAAALRFTSNDAMMDMDEGAGDMFMFASTLFPSRNSRRVPKPKGAAKRLSQTREDGSDRYSEASEHSSSRSNSHHNNQKDKKRSSVASIQADARKRDGHNKPKARFSESVDERSGSGDDRSDPDAERSVSPEEESAEEEDDEDRPPSEEGEEQEEDDVDEEQEDYDEEQEDGDEDEEQEEGSAERSEEPADGDDDEEQEEDEGGEGGSHSSPRSRSHRSESETHDDDVSRTSSSVRGGHKHSHHNHHNHHHHHNQQPPQFHNQQAPTRRASVRRESVSRRASASGPAAPPPPPPPTLLLKKAAPPPPPPPPKKEEPVPVEVILRKNLFDSIKSGNALSVFNSNKTVVAAATKTIDEQLEEQKKVKVSSAKQNEYVAAILANRSKIAGSDSESSDSDSDYTDDDYG